MTLWQSSSNLIELLGIRVRHVYLALLHEVKPEAWHETYNRTPRAVLFFIEALRVILILRLRHVVAFTVGFIDSVL